MIVLPIRTICNLIAIVFAALMLASCGGSNTYSPTTVSGGTAPAVAISITPSSATTTPGGTVQFKAVVTGTTNTAVTWTVVYPGAGTISSTGLYTAPPASNFSASSRAAAIYTVQATSIADASKFATATVTVGTGQVAISIAPQTATTYPSGTVQFTATVTGTTNTAVTWSVVTEGGGTISSTGLFTATEEGDALSGTRGESGGSSMVTIKAVSQADPTKSATAVVTVQPVIISITPVNATVIEGQTIQFSAKVTGAPDQTVSWFGDDGGGVINKSTGLFTAGFVPGGYQIVAYGIAGSQGYADLTVVAPSGISVAITPPSASVSVGGSPVQFTAKVSGTTSQTVKWSIQGSVQYGSISSTGLYTPPASLSSGTSAHDTIVATSVADPTKSATAVVSLTQIPSALAHSRTH